MPTLNFAQVQHDKAARNVHRMFIAITKPNLKGDPADSRLMLQAEFVKLMGEIPGMPSNDAQVATQAKLRIEWVLVNRLGNLYYAIY
jgi:hypothetical protein